MTHRKSTQTKSSDLMDGNIDRRALLTQGLAAGALLVPVPVLAQGASSLLGYQVPGDVAARAVTLAPTPACGSSASPTARSTAGPFY